MIWLTPSSRKAQVVAKSELAGGIGISPATRVVEEEAAEDMALKAMVKGRYVTSVTGFGA